MVFKINLTNSDILEIKIILYWLQLLALYYINYILVKGNIAINNVYVST